MINLFKCLFLYHYSIDKYYIPLKLIYVYIHIFIHIIRREERYSHPCRTNIHVIFFLGLAVIQLKYCTLRGHIYILRTMRFAIGNVKIYMTCSLNQYKNKNRITESRCFLRGKISLHCSLRKWSMFIFIYLYKIV